MLKTEQQVDRPQMPAPRLAAEGRVSAVSWRALILGFLLIPAFDYWVLDMEVRTSAVEPTDLTLLAPAVAVLFVACGINALVARVRRRWALSPGELLVVFSLLVLGVSLSSMNAMPVLIYLMTWARGYATPENRFADRLVPRLPALLTITDDHAIKRWYSGYGSLWNWPTLMMWARPLALWLVFIGCFILAAYCVTTLFWHHWSRSERLTFPVIQLPMAMVSTGHGSLYRNKLFWLGTSIAGGINVINGMRFLFPSLPGIQTAFLANLNDYFNTPPWNAIGWTPINLYPFVIGLGFMMPLDLQFSFVAFYWVWKMERVIGAAMGLEVSNSALLVSGYPYYRQQMMGVWVAIFTGCIWGARHHLAGVWRAATGPRSADTEAPIPYRWCLVGAAAGVLGAVGFLCAAGMSGVMAFAFVLLLLAMYVAIARIRCELGPPCQDLPAAGPDVMITSAYSPNTLGFQSLGVLSMLFFFNGEHYRTAPPGTHLETLKMAEHGGLGGRRYWLALYAATLLGAVVGMAATVQLGYRVGGQVGMHGAPQWYAWQSMTRLDGWVNNPATAPDRASLLAGVVSFAIATAMFQIRTRFFGFPLNPIAYAVTGYWTGDHFWFPILIAYLCKSLILRYTGLSGYRKALPFFMGLIVGEFTVGMAWQVVALILRTNVYTYWR